MSCARGAKPWQRVCILSFGGPRLSSPFKYYKCLTGVPIRNLIARRPKPGFVPTRNHFLSIRNLVQGIRNSVARRPEPGFYQFETLSEEFEFPLAVA